MLKRFFTVALALALLSPLQAEEVRLFLVHTNDIHGHLEASDGNVKTGGYVRVATVIKTLKAAFPGRVVVLDAGDLALGTPTSGHFLGIPTAEAMANVGYDAVAIGNHEFDWGQEAMAKLLKATGAPTLCANLVDEKDGSYPYPPFTVVERGGARIGIIGLVAPDTATRTPRAYTAGWKFLEAEPAMKKALGDLPEVDAVVALTHIGEPADRALAKATPELDLIVGGHSHTPITELAHENGVPIVQSGCYCRFVGVMEVLVDTEADSLKVLEYHLVPIDLSIAPDPEVSAIVQGYADQVRPLLDKVIGQSSAEVLNSTSDSNLDRPLGNLIADALRAETGADVAFYNKGGVRGTMPAGPLDVRTLQEMFPFDDPIVTMTVSGEQLKAIVEEGVKSQAKMSVSGLQASIDKAGQARILVGGEPLRGDRKYRLATTNFLATGGDQMSTLGRLTIDEFLPFTRLVMQSHIEKNPQVSPPPTGRLRRLP